MTQPLAGKTLIITGGFGNLGRVVGQQALKRGANVCLLDYSPVPENLDLLSSANVLAIGGVDVTDREATAAAIQEVLEKFGRLDALLNIAGGFRWETFAESNLENWDFLYNMNVKTAVTTTHAALPHLLKNGGAVVCISAGAALKADLGLAAYAASKAGVSRFVESLSQEVKDRGVRVNAVMPSIIDTPVNRKDMPDADFSTWVSPEALANVLLFLVSDEASAITGAQIPVFNRV